MSEEKKKVVSSIEVLEIPYEVSVPVYIKKEIPEYVLVKEEIVYRVPKIEYENKTYEKPVLVDKEYQIPVYKEVVYEIPKYIEKVYEIPKFVDKVVEVPRIQYIDKQEVKVTEKVIDVTVPNFVKKDITVTDVIVEKKTVTHADIEHVTVQAIHPVYVCSKCRKEIV